MATLHRRFELQINVIWQCLCRSVLGAVLALHFLPGLALAQPQGVATAGVECVAGHYSGRRPTASVYTRDTFTWAVSRRFAAEYCMPKEFIVSDLPAPIEAIAYRLVENLDEQRCNADRPISECSGALEHTLEIYYKHEAIEKAHEGRSFQPFNLPSKYLISEGADMARRRGERAKTNPILGVKPVFEYGQFLLEAEAAGRDSSTLSAFRVKTYYELILDGLDYVSVATGTGFASTSIWAKSGKVATLTINRPANGSAEKRGASPKLLIRLPARINNAMVDADRSQKPFNRQ